MKRTLILIVLCVTLCLSLLACVESGPSTTAGTKPQTPGNSLPTAPSTDSQPKPTTKPAEPATRPTEPQPTTQPTVPETTVPVVPALDPAFSNMPQVSCDFAEVYMTEHMAIFAFITPGMNDSLTTVVTYDLYTDTLLGQVDLGEGYIAIVPLEGDKFCVVDLNHASYKVFDSGCNLEEEISMAGVQAPLGMAGISGNILLCSELMNGQVSLYDMTGGTVIHTELEPDVYEYVGTYADHFLLYSYKLGLVGVSRDGSYEILYSQGYAHVVGDTYIAGVQGDYITLLPLQGGDAVMVPSGVYGEMFIAADGDGLLSRYQHYDKPDVVQYYDTASMTVRQAGVNGMVVNAALQGDHAVVITREDYGSVLKYELVDFGQYEAQSIHSLAYDAGILNGRVPLPEPTGSDKMLSLIEYYQSEYGVRIVYEPDVFDLEYVGYTLYPCTEEEAYEKALLLEKLFQFLPKGIFKEMAESYPLVICLCENVQPSAGGLHTIMDGYSVLFLSVTGNDFYFMNVAAHEMGHALDAIMDYEITSGWQALMPKDVLEASQDRSLTVEYTPDDKGRTPVWFVDVYSRFNDREDRAVLFSYLFDAWVAEDYSILQYEGLRIKANYWAEMLRATYQCCEGYVFPWEGVN